MVTCPASCSRSCSTPPTASPRPTPRPWPPHRAPRLLYLHEPLPGDFHATRPPSHGDRRSCRSARLPPPPAAELVTPGGDLDRADAGHEPDLVWAIRGGGGVVTALEMRLYPVRELYAGGPV